jgi:hypothetical protein
MIARAYNLAMTVSHSGMQGFLVSVLTPGVNTGNPVVDTVGNAVVAGAQARILGGSFSQAAIGSLKFAALNFVVAAIAEPYRTAQTGGKQESGADYLKLDDHQHDGSYQEPRRVKDSVRVNSYIRERMRTYIDDDGVRVMRAELTYRAIVEEDADIYAAEISAAWNRTETASDGAIYRFELVLTRHAGDGRADLIFNRNQNRFALMLGRNNLDAVAAVRAIGRSIIDTSSWTFESRNSLTMAHEFGHVLGLYHQFNSTNSIMSYKHDTRHVTGDDLARVYRCYGEGRC